MRTPPPEPAASLTASPSADAEGAPGGGGKTFHVGPDQTYTKLGDVPWFALAAGDTVLIHYRAEPYHEKILISGHGAPSQWIRVRGVAGPNGELPVISGDGATTGTNMHYRWPDATGGNAIQWAGVVQITASTNDASGRSTLASYIEIANLRIQDADSRYKFTAENGTTANYQDFAACIYARSAQHLLVRDNVLTNCGLGFYNWTGDGSSNDFWAALEVDTVLRRNDFTNNGHAGTYVEHQVYTESDGVIIEGNHFGAQRIGSLGSQIKDRSAGTVIRYNFIEQSPAGWDIDLVEPQEGAKTLLTRPSYKQSFVYGNVIVNHGVANPNIVHWNEDHQGGVGRAIPADARLYFYNNTIAEFVDRTALRQFNVINANWGGYDCPTKPIAGVVDMRNNVFAAMPRSPGAQPATLRFGYCGVESFDFGVNWVSPEWTANGKVVSGASLLVVPRTNDPGFVNAGANDFHLAPGGTARALGAALAPAATSNVLNLDLTPTMQYAPPRTMASRTRPFLGADLGALDSP